uniref:U6 snRNA-associated Sm-like protein LSm1 n=1 Tax=Theileria annulata TaxID=5874 RepID=A0A3B0MKI1_THEAN
MSQESELDPTPHWICSLEDELGSLIWVTLRDDTFYVGLFKSFDQFGNIVITDAVKKIVLNDKKSFSDIYCGYTVIRGESISYFCAIDVILYLNLFNYEKLVDKSLVKKLYSIAKVRGVHSSMKFDVVLNYIPIEEALKLEKMENDAKGYTKLSIDDIVANE